MACGILVLGTIAIALVHGVRMVNAQASIFDSGGSTKEIPEYILILGFNQKAVTLWPTYSVWLKLYGKKNVYRTGEFGWFRSDGKRPPNGEIYVDWTQGMARVRIAGFHLYNGDYPHTMNPELLRATCQPHSSVKSIGQRAETQMPVIQIEKEEQKGSPTESP